MYKKLLPLFLFFLILTNCKSDEVFFDNAICIENISTIDAESGLKENQTLVIKDGKIYKIFQSNQVKLSNKNTIINGNGKYIIPGLWDAHIHFAFLEELAPNMLDLFLGYGITSVRDTGGQIEFVKKWKDKANSDTLNYPRVMIAGPLLDGKYNVYDGSDPWHPHLSTKNNTVQSVEQQVHYLDSLDVDLFKAYEMLTPNQFKKITELARKKGLKVTGHVPLSMDVISASNAGLNSMEHMRNLEMSCASNADELLKERTELLKNSNNLSGAALRSKIHRTQRMKAIENHDDAKANEVFKVLAKNQTWQIPTMTLYVSDRYKEDFKYMPTEIRRKWEKGLASLVDKKNPFENKKYAKWMFKMIKKVHDNKIGIMAGTDTPIAYLTPGLSLHEELNLFVKAGLTPLEALKTATVNPAKYFKLDSKLGLIKENMLADLVILDKNPLEDINNTKQINSVFKNGNYVSRKKLDEILMNVSKK